jgi:hypothetical protein
MQSIETLRNLYYLIQYLKAEGRENIQVLKQGAELIPDNNLQEELRGI